MASNSKNQDIVELIIKGQDEYSDVSEEVRQELEELATQASETRTQFDQLERSLDLAETYRAQEAEVSRLARAQAEAKVEVDRLTKANKEAKGENLEIVEALARARAELGSYRTATNRAQKALDKTKDAMRQYGVSVEQVEKNQREMKESSSRLADELAELQKKQARLVEDAGKQVRAARDKALAQQQYNEALRQQSDAMASQFRSYARQQAEQRKVKAETERLAQELRGLAQQLERGDIGWEDFRRRAADAGRAADLTQKQVAGVRRSLEGLVVASRQANQALEEQAREARRVEQATEDYRHELGRLLDKYSAGKIDIDRFEAAEAQLRRKLKLNEQQVESTRREMGAYRDELKKIPVAQAAANRSTDKLTMVTRRLAQAYTVLLAAQKSLDLAMSTGRAYAESEAAMLGLQKTTELTATEISGLVAEMDKLSGDVTSSAKTELLAVAEAAGRMGIEGARNIADFTKSIDALSSATDLAGDETAQAIAQILNVTGEAQENVTGVAAVIAELGNTTATTEDQIVHFAKRLATDTKTANLASAEVLGIAASMAEMGLQAEGASTVIGRTFRFIEDAVKGGGKSMEDLQRITGQTEAEIRQAFGEDKVALFTSFISGISRVQDGGETLNQILSDMGIKSDENARILGLLSRVYGRLNQNVAVANKAFAEGTAHFEEMAKKEASLSSSMQRLQNRIKNLAGVMGEAFADDILRGMGRLREDADLVEGQMAELAEATADVVTQLSDMVSTISGLADPFRVLTGGTSLLEGALFGVSFALDGIGTVINTVVKATAELGIAWNKLTGDTEDIKAWQQVWLEADERINKAVKRQMDNVERLAGVSSRAFQDLRDAYNENRDALERMDEEQRKAVETIINSTGYLEGNDEAYRSLTRAIQRAAEEKRIIQGLTREENAAVEEHISLLRAQGVEEEEAARIAIDAAQKRQQQAQQKKQQAEEQADLEKRLADQRQAQLTAEKEAFSALGLNMEEVTGKLTEHGAAVVSAFETIAASGKYTGDTIRVAMEAALEQLKTPEDFEAFKELLDKLGEKGFLAGEMIEEGMELATDAIRRMHDESTLAFGGLEGSLAALGLSLDRLETGMSKAGNEAVLAFSTIVSEADRAGYAGKDAADTIMHAFESAFDRLETTTALEKLEAEIKKAYREGQISAEDFNRAQRLISEAYKIAAVRAKESAKDQIASIKEVEAALMDQAAAQEETKGDNKDEDIVEQRRQAAIKRREEAEKAEEAAAKAREEARKLEEEQQRKEEEREKERAKREKAREKAERQQEKERAAREAALQEQQRAKEEEQNRRQAQAAERQLRNTVAGLEIELARLSGDTERVLRLQHEQKLAALQEAMAQAEEYGATGAVSAASKAMRLQRQIYEKQLSSFNEQRQGGAPEAKPAERSSRPETVKTEPVRVIRLQIDIGDGKPVEGRFEESEAERLIRQLREKGAVVR